MLLVTLAIAWAAAGVHWLRTRAVVPSLGMPGAARRRPVGLSFMSAGGNVPQGRVLPLRSGPTPPRAGHSLIAPARDRIQPGVGPQPNASFGQPVSSEQARVRRRNVLVGLAGAAAFTLLLAVVFGGSMIVVNLFCDALLLGYVLLLVQYQREIELEQTRQRPLLDQPPRHLASTGTDAYRSR